MPEPLPSWSESYDDPPASQPSYLRNRRSRLQRALQTNADVAQDAGIMADSYPLVREAPPSRRRRRSPSETGGNMSNNEEGIRRRRSKRRRLDPPAADEVRRAIRYGYFGQVEPGRLQMELLSCDGGEHVDSRYPHAYLGAKNCLRHDKSVYCSERSHTNLVLVHADRNAFCLEKLHVVSPEHGFTAPVREGLVYVAMTIGDLQQYIDPPYHARQRGIHSPPYRHQSVQSSPEQISLADALRDPEVNAAAGHVRGRPIDGESDDTRVPALHSRQDYPSEDPDPLCELLPIPAEYVEEEASEVPVAFLVDEDAGPEDTSSQDVLDFRLQRLRLMRRRHEIDNWTREDRRANSSHQAHDSTDSSAFNRYIARTRMDDTPEDTSDDARVVGAGVEEGMKDNNVTCARFQIEEGKHKVAIRFVPPVSGRFILLKLWAGRNKVNVDVQTIIAQGYGTLRFFPAKSFR